MEEREEIQERINMHYDHLLTKHMDECVPFVCSFCDKHVINECNQDMVFMDQLADVQDLFNWERYPDSRRNGTDIEDQYTFLGKEMLTFKVGDDGIWMDSLCLSPCRTPYKISSHGNAKCGLSSCVTCKIAIDRKQCPSYSIINKNYVGECPECIRQLTLLEVAVLLPVKNYGYCYVWSGSEMDKTMALKGSLTFMQVEQRKITKAAAQLESLGLKNKILILYTGQMTKHSKRQLKRNQRF